MSGKIWYGQHEYVVACVGNTLVSVSDNCGIYIRRGCGNIEVVASPIPCRLWSPGSSLVLALMQKYTASKNIKEAVDALINLRNNELL